MPAFVSMNALDCIIYSTGKISILKLRNEIATLVNSEKITVSFIEKDFYELSVYVNDEHDFNKQMDFPDGFLFFKFIIEVGFTKSCEIKECVQVISPILLWLWQIGMSAVASCDYENFLPENGGYESKVIPWPNKN